MKVIGSIIARVGSKRLPYKNLLPFNGTPLIGIGIETLNKTGLVDEVVVSTESELIARIAKDFGATVLRRPQELAEDNIPSIPVFQHIMEHFDADIHINYNINFPICPPEVIDRALQVTAEYGEALSVPFAVWGQTRDCLDNYRDPWKITAHKFEDSRIGSIDIHTEQDLLDTYRLTQGQIPNWDTPKKTLLTTTRDAFPEPVLAETLA